MKKFLAVFAAAAILCACGCGKQTVQNQTTVPDVTGPVTEPQYDDNIALPAVNDSISATDPVLTPTQPAPTAPPTAPAPDTTVPTAAVPDQTAPTAPAATEPTTQAPAETTTQPVTEKPTETTTQAPKTAEMLQNAVLAPINSGTYTMRLRAFLKDHSKDDQLAKSVRGGDTAYRLSIPKANLTMRVFSDNGQYYLVAANQYCTLTKAQYSDIANTFDTYFPDFSSMQYQKTETGGSLLNRYTEEYFDVGGTTVVLRFEKGALSQIQSGGVTLPFTVSSGADSGEFGLASDLTQVEYSDMEFLAGLTQMF